MSQSNSTDAIYVLSISANEDDHAWLGHAFSHSRWVIVEAAGARDARTVLAGQPISVVVCDCDSLPEEWADVIEAAHQTPNPPPVILTSRIADERLWVRSLELGAWDVLAKPLLAADVVRTVRYAWEQWRRQYASHVSPKIMTSTR